MATGVQLSKLVKDLRAECGHSLAVAQGQATEDTLRYMLGRQQEELYEGYDWPALRIYRKIVTAAGQRYYDYPDDLPFDRVRRFWCHTTKATDWTPIEKGIDPMLFTTYDSEGGVRAWPPRRWEHNADQNQIELWPVPDRDQGEIIIYGMKPLAPLLKSDDVCTLDGTLLVLFTAVEVAAKTSPREGELKAQKAQRHLQRILGNQGSKKRAWTSLARGLPPQPVIGLDYIPRFR
jgi:hypothetical protein